MMRIRAFRGPVALALTLALTLMLAAPALVSAKPAALAFGFGPIVGGSLPSGALPAAASPGSKVAFDIWARNGGKSNISKLFLTATTTGTFHSVTVTNFNGAKGSCGPGPGNGVELSCSWKPLSKGGAVQVRVVFTTPSTGDSMPVLFEWSSSGYVPGSNNSHGDLFVQTDSVALNGDANLFAGGFLTTGDDPVVQTNPALGEGNPQSTKITSPAFNIPVTAGENNDISDCEEVFEECFGQASIISVNNGQTFPGGFTVHIVYNAKHYYAQFVHFFDDGTYEELEECYGEPVAPCVEVSIYAHKTFVTAYLTENGKIIGH